MDCREVFSVRQFYKIRPCHFAGRKKSWGNELIHCPSLPAFGGFGQER
jgi:hypothetical protein